MSVENVSRIYIGSVSKEADKIDLECIFNPFGKILSVEIKPGAENLPCNYAFIDYDNESSASAAVDALNGKRELLGQILKVELSHGKRNTNSNYLNHNNYRDMNQRNNNAPMKNSKPAGFRVNISNLDESVSWMDLKDWAREAGEVIYANVNSRERSGVIEFQTQEAKVFALRNLDGRDFKNSRVRITSQDHFDGYSQSRGSGSSSGYGRERDDDFRRAPQSLAQNNDRGAYTSRRDDRFSDDRDRRQPPGSYYPPSNSRINDVAPPPSRNYRSRSRSRDRYQNNSIPLAPHSLPPPMSRSDSRDRDRYGGDNYQHSQPVIRDNRDYNRGPERGRVDERVGRGGAERYAGGGGERVRDSIDYPPVGYVDRSAPPSYASGSRERMDYGYDDRGRDRYASGGAGGSASTGGYERRDHNDYNTRPQSAAYEDQRIDYSRDHRIVRDSRNAPLSTSRFSGGR